LRRPSFSKKRRITDIRLASSSSSVQLYMRAAYFPVTPRASPTLIQQLLCSLESYELPPRQRIAGERRSSVLQHKALVGDCYLVDSTNVLISIRLSHRTRYSAWVCMVVVTALQGFFALVSKLRTTPVVRYAHLSRLYCSFYPGSFAHSIQRSLQAIFRQTWRIPP
jgi:hypothetical protein